MGGMDQRISLITLGVDDLARARDFYERGLGWTPSGDFDGVSFYQLPGIAFALFGRGELAEDARHPVDGRFSGITIAINQRSAAEVDATLAEAQAAGATILKPAEKTPWGGYSGYFADPDGHVWEVAHNPAWTINDDGTLAYSFVESVKASYPFYVIRFVGGLLYLAGMFVMAWNTWKTASMRPDGASLAVAAPRGGSGSGPAEPDPRPALVG